MSAPLSLPSTRIDIGVCTFRRPELEQTLRSLAGLALPDGVSVRVIVADNDASPSARPLVDGLRPSLPFDLLYVHCPVANISIARNACLQNSDGDFLAFIDDDEVASTEWLLLLHMIAEATGADAVLGPVRARYGADAPGWMRRGDFHSTAPVWVGDEIRTGYTCNVMLRRASPAVTGRRFNLALGKSGGEDTDYFTHLHRSGGKIAYAADAFVEEPVPPARARLSWLARRRFRMGQTHGRLLAGQAPMAKRPAQLALAAIKAGFCLLAGLACAPFAIQRNRYGLRAVLHIGVVSGLIGVREIRQYGELGATSP